MNNRTLIGIVLAVLAGLCWGSMSVAAQYLMACVRFDATDLSTLRMLGAGLMLLAFERLRGNRLSAILGDRRNLRDLCFYSAGMLGIQWTFFLSIDAANAATAALMVTTGPLFVIGWTAWQTKRLPSLSAWTALALAAAGTTLIVTKGSFDALDFSPAGVLWGMTSAACGAFCTIQPKRLLERVSVGVVAGFGMTAGGVMLALISPPALSLSMWTPEVFGLYFYIAFVGTVLAFCFYLGSLAYVSASTTSLLGMFEPLSSVVLSAMILGLAMNSAEWIGTVLILLMTAILARH